MVSYKASSGSESYEVSASTVVYEGSGTSYSVKSKATCCGSWNRGQRCSGCPAG